jgi:anti-sigma B factor antagonist
MEVLHHVEVVELNGVARLVISGEIDITQADAVLATLRHYVAATATVELDLAALEYIDSTGLSALLAASEMSRAHGRDFRVVAASGIVRRVLEVSGVAPLLGLPATFQ